MKIHFKSIRYKLILILFLSSVLPLSLSMYITFSYSRHNFSNEIISYNQQLMYQFSNNIATKLQTISSGIYYPFSNAKMYSFLTKKDSLRSDDRDTVMSFMQSIQNLSSDISSITLQCFNKKISYKYENRVLTATSLSKTIYYPNDYTPHFLTEESSANRNSAVSFYLNLRSIPEKESIGALKITLSSAAFDGLSQDMLNDSDETIFILEPASSNILYSTEASDKHTLPDEIQNIITQLSSSSGYQKYNFESENKVLFFETITVLNIPVLIIKTIPLMAAYKSIFQMLRIYLPTYIIFLVISIVLTWKFSASFTRPITQLAEQMQNIEQGKKYVPLKLKSDNEISLLNHSFNSMLQTIQILKIHKYELELSIKDAQLKMLQAQLNPHFLNNTLQSLGTLALQSHSPKLYSLITNLALMMNYAMDIEHPLIPLKEEFDYCEKYLIFQQQRFGDMLHFSLQPDPQTFHIMVPKMIMQPVMENYFKHGFVKRKEGYCISAKSCFCDNILTIFIQNNGASLPEQQLQVLKNTLSSVKSTSTFTSESSRKGIGLDNIQKRLYMYYDSTSAITIDNVDPYGIVVTITLALKGDSK